MTDPGSTNGTFVNGQRVGQVELRDGDLIQIGDFALIVELSAHAPHSDEQRAGTMIGVAMSNKSRPARPPDLFDLRVQPTATIGRDPGNEPDARSPADLPLPRPPRNGARWHVARH